VLAGLLAHARLEPWLRKQTLGDNPMTDSNCLCLNAPLPYDQYAAIRFIGVDETEGRFGEVSLKQCKHCGRYWLHYSVEYEHQSGSGRYFMGVITPEAAKGLTPEMAIDYLDALDWHLYGGSYFRSKGRATGKVGLLV
jgi:hypothetical protein